ncbi:MAG: hypothetical protein DRQ43_07965 [Gammaproteobacteria bacterium]|nr:MAG: hypothetical protein DRQ43_07965 [Gammaproteobacteria bacterium]
MYSILASTVKILAQTDKQFTFLFRIIKHSQKRKENKIMTMLNDSFLFGIPLLDFIMFSSLISISLWLTFILIQDLLEK